MKLVEKYEYIEIVKDKTVEFFLEYMPAVEFVTDIAASGIKIIKIAMVLFSMSDKLYYKKLEKFFKGVYEINQSDKEKYIEKYEKYLKKDCETILNIIDKVEDEEKIDYLVILYKKLVYGDIDRNTFFRLCNLIRDMMVVDLKMFLDVKNFSEINDSITIYNFERLGLIDFEKNWDEIDRPAGDRNNLENVIIKKLGNVHRDTINSKE